MDCDFARGEDRRTGFYTSALRALKADGIEFLVGGAYGLAWHIGHMSRPVKDLDLLVRRRDVDAALASLRTTGARTSVPHAHWLAKAHLGKDFIDVIFGSGNGEVVVDDAWFEHARDGRLFGVPVRYCPPEEGIWTRSFVMERERFDGADVAHLLRACGPSLDWGRLVDRFGRHWRILLAHLVLFEFIYPDERDRVPEWVFMELVRRLRVDRQTRQPDGDRHVCRGTLLSRSQYERDVEDGYYDARIAPRGRLTEEGARSFTRAARKES
jgi:hypothetical protein